jgi:UDP-N-acetylmuramoylalanine-D-glutamate ligase
VQATNIDAAYVGISGLEQPAVVLLGGLAKRLADGTLGFEYLVSALSCHRGVVTFGHDGQQIADELAMAGVACHTATSLRDAVELGMGLAQPGEASKFHFRCR